MSIAALAVAGAILSTPVAAQGAPPNAPLPQVTVDQPRAPVRSRSPASHRPVVAAPRPSRSVRRTAMRRLPARPIAAAAPAPVIPAAPATALDVDRRLQAEGTAAQGYKTSTAGNVGPFGAMPLLDTPYSIQSISSDFIRNTLSSSADDVFRRNPLVQQGGLLSTYPGNPYILIRGFSDAFNDQQNGLFFPYYPIPFLEAYERVDISSGLTGFLNGGSSSGRVGGSVDYITKRPTATPLASLTIGNYGNANGFVNADVSNNVDPEGRIGYRVNALAQAGGTAVESQKLQRYLLSGALDFHIAPNILLQFNMESFEYHLNGVAPYFRLGAGQTAYPSAPAADKLFSQPFTYSTRRGFNVGSNLTWDVSDHVTFRGGMLFGEQHSGGIFAFDTINPNGTYSQTLNPSSDLYQYGVSSSLLGDVKFDTFGIGHKVTLGFRGTSNQADEAVDSSTSNQTVLTGSLASPLVVDPGSVHYAGTLGQQPVYKLQTSSQGSYLVGDYITVNPWLSFVGGVADVNVKSTNFNPDGSVPVGSAYDKSQATPTGAIIIKPLPNLALYGGYIQSLEPGTFVGQGFSNSGQTLPPLTSEQEEVGAKYDFGGALLTGALFRIDKANQYSNNSTPLPTFVQDGREIHQGAEITLTGKVTERLTLVGGGTWFDARVEQTSTPMLAGKHPVSVSPETAKLYAEYALPFVLGLTLTGGVFFNGPFYADTMNTIKLPSYTTGDVGFRYETLVDKTPVTFRFLASNVTNHSYWVNANFVGAPRTLAFSATAKF